MNFHTDDWPTISSTGTGFCKSSALSSDSDKKDKEVTTFLPRGVVTGSVASG